MGPIGEERIAAESFELFKCLECSSISLFPDPKIDYTNHTSDDLAIKHYLELNASIEWMAVNVMSVIGDRRSGRLLDIGCGYGFSADVAKKLAGWLVVGVEPSNYGRRGAKALKLNIIHEFIDERHPIARERFDIIHASEVIEHIADPGKFLVFLRSMLEDDGVLVITTPDASALGMSISDSQRRAILSIGAHVVLFTQDGLSTLLRRVGFGNVQIELRGATLVAFAGNGPTALTAVQPARLGLQYCEALLASPIDDDYLEAGIRYRYFRHLVELGEYEKAFRLVHLFDQTNNIAIKCSGSTEFASKFRMFDGVILFYLGILNLNFVRNIESARDNFLRSNAICAEKLRLFEETSVFDHNIMWRSLLHVAICDEQLGHTDRSKHIYEQILSANVGPDGNVPADILEAAKTAFTRLGETIRTSSCHGDGSPTQSPKMRRPDLESQIPIFIPSFNNPTYLVNMIDQLFNLGLRNITVVDNGSTFSPMHSLLQSLDERVVVIRKTQNVGPRHLFQDTESYRSLPDYFCITDPDLKFNTELPADFLRELIDIIEEHKVGKAGFSLDISDRYLMIQDDFQIGEKTYKIWEWEAQFWKYPFASKNSRNPVFKAPIDTTFALYNKTYFDPACYLDAVRIAGTFTCRHLPWYRERSLPADEEAFYRSTTKFSYFLCRTV